MRYGAQLARVFSTTFARQVINGKGNSYLKEMSDVFSFMKEVISNCDYDLLYRYAFMLLANDYRNEYVYKTMFYTCLLKEKEKINQLDVVTELRIGNSISDIASFGSKKTSNSVEIKSDIDNVKKSLAQVVDYQKMFPSVYLISSRKQIDSIFKELSRDVGLLVLNMDLSIDIIRNAKYNDKMLDIKTMFYTLRRNEYESVIFDYYHYVPNVPSGKIFTECFDLAMKIPTTDFYRLFRKRIAERIHNEDIDIDVPDHLIFVGKKSSLTKKEKYLFMEKVMPV
jgi:hypothetical protein